MTMISGKYTLLTGASRGIGPFIAEALAARGAHIALAARSAAGLQETAQRLAQYGVQTMIVPVDLAVPDEQARLVDAVMARFGRIDILVNNAALETEGAFLSHTWETFQQTIEVNFSAPLALTHHVLPHMVSRKAGHVVNIASVGAKSGGPYDAVYCGTKAGLAEWARSMRLELQGSGIQFSSIFPGYVTDAGMFAKFNMAPLPVAGSCTPAQVAWAVVRAIERNRVDVVVNSIPARWLFALNEISPALGDWFMNILGVVRFQRKKAGNGRIETL